MGVACEPNRDQQTAIKTTEGPLLIIAGPGTGKTHTLIQRALYLIKAKQIKPEGIFIATFTEKAAKELVTRITDELKKNDIDINLNEMYIGTFHSLCLRLLQNNLEHTRLKKNFRVLDSFDQCYVVFQNFYRFEKIPNIDLLFQSKSVKKIGVWKKTQKICSYVNALHEELIDPEKLKRDKDPRLSAIGEILLSYNKLLEEQNLMDFSSIQTETWYMLKSNKAILRAFQEKVKYFMIDEYQDTNHIQEQLVFLLAGKGQNICVVGDDDQGLYRFRGATIRNILEFPNKFSQKTPIVKLTANYRSNPQIIDFYNKWMQIESAETFKWDKFRYPKKIVATRTDPSKKPVVLTVSGCDVDKWYENIYRFVQDLKKSHKLKDYNQIAFLFNSVKNPDVVNLARYFEAKGINVYSPRSAMYFKRKEIQFAIGCLLLLFPGYVQKLIKPEERLKSKSFKFLKTELIEYYRDCIQQVNQYIKEEAGKNLKQWIKKLGRSHLELKHNTDYAFAGLFYQLLQFEPFSTIIDTDIKSGIVDQRPVRNLALLSSYLSKYEFLNNIDVLSPEKIETTTERFFNLYMRLLFEEGLDEYEDEAEYAPSGCVSFLTIHQSKGLEFPIVIVGSLGNSPKTKNDEIMKLVENKFYKRKAFEPAELIKFFDFWRLYYTAFSRAKDLLVLTTDCSKRRPSKSFKNIYSKITAYDRKKIDLTELSFAEVSKSELKQAFSFTSHIAVYQNCPLQYKFFKELGFTPVRAGAIMFGTLVHETIEDIHKAVLRKEESKITDSQIEQWFEINYQALIKRQHTYLGEKQKRVALNEVIAYAKREKANWHLIQQAEADVSLVRPNYIIEGKIDLIKGENGTVEIVDFKSEKKPDIEKQKDRIEHYQRQLQLYAHILEQKMGCKISKMKLYYTAETEGVPTISFPYNPTAIEGTVKAFDSTVKKILKKDFNYTSTNPKSCANCDFRFHCKKNV